jgi:DUF1680 family protein
VQLSDPFWLGKQELIRTEVLPYEWQALNDAIPGAEPSFCLHNFRAAANVAQSAQGRPRPQTQTQPQVNMGTAWDGSGRRLPDDPRNPDPGTFYGNIATDSDGAKWIEAVAYSLANTPDSQLEAHADSFIDTICAAQLPNGYLDTFFILGDQNLAFTDLQYDHELYCFGHLVEAAVAYCQSTGKRKLLDAACRFADYIDSRIGREAGKIHGYPGHELAEMALVRLYEQTGRERYLQLAEYFVNERGREPHYFCAEREEAKRRNLPYVDYGFDLSYFQAHRPIREQHEAVGHAVRAVYLYSGAADIARTTGDETLARTCTKLWRNIVDRKLYITGGIGGTQIGESFSYDYDLPNDLAYSETCAAVGLVFFASRMLRLEPKAEYADVMERTLYNTVLDGMALDGKSFFYVNPLEVVPEASHKDQRKQHVNTVRQRWFSCACCPPNLARLVTSLQQYAYSENDTTLWTHLYVAGSVEKRFAAGTMRLEMQSDLPWSGAGQARISTNEERVTATLAFRVPGWSTPQAQAIASLCVTADAGITREIHDGYVYLTGTWNDGDTVSWDFPMPVRTIQANARVRENANTVAFIRGPLTFCMEQVDNGPDLHLVHADLAAIGEHCQGIAVEECVIEGNRMIRLLVPASREVTDTTFQNASTGTTGTTDEVRVPLYTDYHPSLRTPFTAKLIPYFAWANRGENEMRVWMAH